MKAAAETADIPRCFVAIAQAVQRVAVFAAGSSRGNSRRLLRDSGRVGGTQAPVVACHRSSSTSPLPVPLPHTIHFHTLPGVRTYLACTLRHVEPLAAGTHASTAEIVFFETRLAVCSGKFAGSPCDAHTACSLRRRHVVWTDLEVLSSVRLWGEAPFWHSCRIGDSRGRQTA